MNIDKLVGMANRIGEFFATFPDRDQALRGIADHLRLYWTAGMRAELFAALDADRTPGLSELAREALAAHRSTLAPRTAKA